MPPLPVYPMSAFHRLTFAAIAFGALFACSESPTEPPPPPIVPVVPPPPAVVVAGVTVTGPTRLTVGRSDTVRATPRTSSGEVITGRSVTYSSSNTASVTVAASGVVTAAAPGTAVISAIIEGITGTITILASDATFTTFTITAPSAPVLVGGTGQFTASARDSVNAPVAIRSITWTSDNPSIATVSPTGVVTGRAPGTVTISAEAIGNTGLRASATLTVVSVPVASVVLAPVDTILQPRFPKQLVATVRDSVGNVLSRPITFTSSNVDVAVLDDFGLVTATGKGPVTITASSGGKNTSVRLYVPPDSGLFVTTIGGVAGDIANVSLDLPNASTPSTLTGTIGADLLARLNFITSPGTYRVRANTTANLTRAPVALAGIALMIGETNSVASILRPPSTVVTVPLKAYTATINAPTSVTVNSTVTVTWTFDESVQSFSTFPDQLPGGTLYVSSTNGPDLAGQPVAATVTRLTNGTISFSATFTAPATSGTVFIQVTAEGPTSRLLFPISFRGQSLQAITVQ